MYISVFMGPFARGPRDDRAVMEYCIESAIKAADAGFSMVTFGEQHFNNYEPYCNPFLMGARLAPFLKNAYFGTTMCPLPFHNPIMLAENINVLDQLLAGKLIVGMSAGRIGFSPDFENFGLDPKEQRAIFAEKFAALERLWSHKPEDGPVKFEGPWVKGGMHGRLMPVSYRAPRPLLAIGTSTDATCRKTGKDGLLLSLGPATIADAAGKFALYREGLDEGNHPEAQKSECLAKSLVHHQFVVGSTDDAAWALAEKMAGMNPLIRRDVDPRSLRQMSDDGKAGKSGMSEMEQKHSTFMNAWFVVGSPSTIVAELEAHRDAGIQHVLTRFAVGPYNPPVWDESYQYFVGEVLPKVDPQLFAAPSNGQIQPAVAAGPMPAGVVFKGYNAQDANRFRQPGPNT